MESTLIQPQVWFDDISVMSSNTLINLDEIRQKQEVNIKKIRRRLTREKEEKTLRQKDFRGSLDWQKDGRGLRFLRVLDIFEGSRLRSRPVRFV